MDPKWKLIRWFIATYLYARKDALREVNSKYINVMVLIDQKKVVNIAYLLLNFGIAVRKHIKAKLSVKSLLSLYSQNT